jgi:hypothetical protein
MSATVIDDVSRYVAAVRSALADLPAEQRDELLEDLPQHLREVAAESDAPLSTRLGPPAEYAAELRASVGLPATVSRAGIDRMEEVGERIARIRDAAVVQPAVRATLDFLPELRPGWWVLRGYLSVEVLSWMTDYGARDSFPIPTFSGTRVLGLAGALAAMVASVALGRRTASRPSWTPLVVIGNTLLVLAVLAALGSGQFAQAEPTSSVASPSFGSGSLIGPDGTPITNIYPFGPDGWPLTGVRLFDQDGRPIDNLAPYGPDGVPIERRLPVTADGSEVTNAFPMEQSGHDPATGQAAERTGPPLSVPPLATAASSASPAPSAPSPFLSASPSPSPGRSTPPPPSSSAARSSTP